MNRWRSMDMSPTAVRDALRPMLLRDDLCTTGGFRLVDIVTDTTTLTVLFRWNDDAATYGLPFPLPEEDSPTSPWTGCPVEDEAEWAAGARHWIQEELDTGLMNGPVLGSRDGYLEVRRRHVPRPGCYGEPTDRRTFGWCAGAGHPPARWRRVLDRWRLRRRDER